MDSHQDLEELHDPFDEVADEKSVSVDDFIKQLEVKEKDLHITADTTIIEISEGFEDGEIPDFLKEDFSFESATRLEPAVKPVTADKPSIGELEKELALLKSKIAKMDEERAEMFKNSQRRSKDFENLKARTERERKDTFQSQVGNLATMMLPALDNLSRALDFAEQLPEEKSGEFQQFYQGIYLVNQQVIDIFGKMGIEPIRTLGQRFDPHYHEAVSTEEKNEYPPNTICAEMMRGYRIGDRVLRHSMVKVSKSALNEEKVVNKENEGEMESDMLIEFITDESTPETKVD